MNELKLDTTFKVKDPVSALTHLIGMILAIIAMPVLLIDAQIKGKSLYISIGYAVFMISMVILYAASSSYHGFRLSKKGNVCLKKFDHMAIPVLIAGTYTPICIGVLQGNAGKYLLIAIWTCAFICMSIKLFFVFLPRFVSSLMYLLMGWLALSVMGPLYALMDRTAFLLLLTGGICYSAGALIYAWKRPLIDRYGFGNHELFHILVMLGSLFHYLMMFFI